MDIALELVGNCFDTDNAGFHYLNCQRAIYPLQYYEECVPDALKPALQSLEQTYMVNGHALTGITAYKFHMWVRKTVISADPAFKFMCGYDRDDDKILKCETIAIATLQWWREQAAKQMHIKDSVLTCNNQLNL